MYIYIYIVREGIAILGMWDHYIGNASGPTVGSPKGTGLGRGKLLEPSSEVDPMAPLVWNPCKTKTTPL